MRKSKKEPQPQRLDHGFGPLFSEASEILILGSFPSVKSREAQFYYGHPQNRFWRILRALFDEETAERLRSGEKIDPPATLEEKKALILEHGLALWDTIESCTITGSSDSSIRDVVVTDLPWLLQQCPIQKIYCNGNMSYQLFQKYSMPVLEEWCRKQKREAPLVAKLPSTSPANAAWSLERLLAEWKVIVPESNSGITLPEEG